MRYLSLPGLIPAGCRRLLLAVLTCGLSSVLLLAGTSQHVASAHAAADGAEGTESAAVTRAAQAAADGGAAFSVRPISSSTSPATPQPYFIFDAAPGATVHGVVRVTNAGTAIGTASLYPVDATTGQTGGLVYRPRQAPRTDVGAWVVFDHDAGTGGGGDVGEGGVPALSLTLTLVPQQSRLVPFTATIPPNAEPGTHVGGLVAEDTSAPTASATASQGGGGGVRITIQHLAIVAVEIEVAGPAVERLEVTSISAHGPRAQSVDLALRNSGTVLLKSSGRLQLLDATANVLYDDPFQVNSFLPQTSIDYPLALSGPPLEAGVYQALVTLAYGPDHQQTVTQLELRVSAASSQRPGISIGGLPIQSPTWWALPEPLPLLLGLIGGLLLVGGGATLLLARRRQRSGAGELTRNARTRRTRMRQMTSTPQREAWDYRRGRR